jgi:galacturan 1,4-alpha-galacturonidase
MNHSVTHRTPDLDHAPHLDDGMAPSRNLAMAVVAAAVVSSLLAAPAVLASKSLKAVAEPASGGGAPSVPAGPLDIVHLGAKGDGKSDSTPAILKAWKNACDATGTQKIIIPAGIYLTGALELKGPCKSSIIIRLDGVLLGTGDLNAYKKNWIEVQNVDNFQINGHGSIDGQGSLVWKKNQCQKSYNCQILPNVRTAYIIIYMYIYTP